MMIQRDPELPRPRCELDITRIPSMRAPLLVSHLGSVFSP